MMSRSNSARAPKTWKISFPPLVFVSVDGLRQASEPHTALAQVGDRLDEVLEAAAETVD